MNAWQTTLEITCLHPTASVARMEQALEEVKNNGLAGLCVPPFWVKKIRRDLGNHLASLATVIGFPYGYQRTEAKMTEITQALADGATDLEVMVNTSALLSPSVGWIKVELAKCAKLIHEQQAFLTVIIEPSFLEAALLRKVCRDSADAGVDFVKIGTGLSNPTHQTVREQVQLVRESLPASVGIKVAYVLESAWEAQELLDLGAERICVENYSEDRFKRAVIDRVR